MSLSITIPEITLDINEAVSQKLLIAHQGDTKTRYVKVKLTQNGAQITLDSSTMQAIIKASINGIVKAVNDCTISENKVTAELTAVMLDTPGTLDCEISIIEDNKCITSAVFAIYVQQSTASDESQITASAEYGALNAALTSIADVAEKAELVQEMVDNIADLQSANNLITRKTDYYKITGDVDLNWLDGSTFSPMVETTIYNLCNVQVLGHSPVTLTGGYRGYVIVSRQSANDVATAEQELHLIVPDRRYPGGMIHQTYTRLKHPDVSGTHWTSFVTLANSVDINNLQQQIDNLPSGGTQLSGNVSFVYNGSNSSVQGTGVIS